MPAVLVDTGPLVALLDRSDPYHLTCQETLSSLDDSLVTVWPVVTEAMYMLRAYWQAQVALWEMIGAGAVEIIPLGIEDLPRMRELMRKYRDQPMDLADAALVRVAERERLRRIFTLDRRDFQIYRPSRIGRFAVLPSR
ncbi:MAG: PIN domain-containing protein [Deltaproteobacteria bacterium]|nr:MAG: PIN domain-containing protein [Deltaproteobacteria bacterium]